MGFKHSFGLKGLVLLFFSAFILRVFLSSFGTLELDFNTFRAWGDILVERGFGRFYEGWSDYLPGYLYVLWVLGKISSFLSWIPETLLYKFPAILADVATGIFIYLTVRKFNQKLALPTTLFYLLNPAVIANSTLWGQVDSLTALFVVASLFFAKKSLGISSLALALGTLIKPQAGFIAPLLGIMWLKNYGPIKVFIFSVLCFFVFVMGFLPFANGKELLPFVLERLSLTANQYPYTSVNAFNLWAIFPGMWQSDIGRFQLVGIITTVVILTVVTLSYMRRVYILRFTQNDNKKGQRTVFKRQDLFLLSSIFLLVSFLFLTRMHERHLLPVLAPLIIAASSYPLLIISYFILSATYVLNLFYAYVWINNNFKEIFSREIIALFSFANLVVGGLMIFSFFKKYNFQLPFTNFQLISNFSIHKFLGNWKLESGNWKSGLMLNDRYVLPVLLGIIFLTFVSRIYSLWHPPDFYFDEVYHAFTAREILRGNTASWEWWADPPEGFAYEWTHPPMAKLGMVLGMKIFGEYQFAWRLPGALLGTGSVFLVYLLALKIFKNKTIGVFSAAVFSLEGLTLVSSRIGMNDTYFLFFALLAILLFLKEKYLFSSIALGLAAASKWTTMWVVVVLVIAMLIFRLKPRFHILWFALVPIIYVLSYTTFFLTGHNVDQFIGLQQQMWWYHTGLVATHSYQSSALTWPLDARPVWLFVERRGDLISNIYMLGNPLVLWLGLASIFYAAFIGILKKNLTLIFVVVCWGVLFLPWSISPRVMFLYHYLPAIPFLSITTGWFLSQQNKKFIVTCFVLLVTCYLFFFPHWAGIFVPTWFDDLYYLIPSWK